MDGTATVSGVEVNVVSARMRLRQYVSRALFRLRAQEALRALNVSVLLILLLLMVTIFADRYCSLTRMGINVYLIWGCIAALGIPYILWRAFSPRLHEELASVLTDDRLGLNSRLSTALTLDLNDAQNAAFSEAFFAEALDKLRGLNVEVAFPVKMPRSGVLSLMPLTACAAMYMWMPYQDGLGLLADAQKKRKAEEIQKTMARKLDGKLEDLKRKVDEHADEQSQQYKVNQLIQQADKISKDLKDGKRNPEEAAIALGQLKREIAEEREKMTQGKEFLDRLEKLKAENLNLEENDLTKDVSNALKMGDAGLAAREMRKLAQKMKDEILNDDSKSAEEKEKALEKLKNEVTKLAEALSQDEGLKDNLMEVARKSMSAAEFQQLQDEIQKQAEKQGKGNKKMGEDLEKEMEDVAEELERLEEDNDAKLSEEDEKESEQLDEVEEAADEALEGMEGEGGEGQEGQQGKQQDGGKQGSKPGGKKGKKGGQNGEGRGMKGKGKMSRGGGGQQGGKEGRQGGRQGGQGQQEGRGQQQPGPGLGGGPGSGHRPYQDGDATFQKEKVTGKLQSGAITGISHFRGQGAKGDAPVEFVKALQAAEQEASSSLELERIPNDAKEVVKDYFSKVKAGSTGGGGAPQPEKPPATFDGTK
jgi:hypothetical protein